MQPTDPWPTVDEVLSDQRLRRVVAAIARRLGLDAHEAEDVVQETFLRVWRGFENFDGENLVGWVARIATNVIRDIRRRRGTRADAGAAPLDDAARQAPSDADVFADVAHEDWRETWKEILRTVAAEVLSERDHDVFLLKQEGRSHEEVAEELGIPPGTVASRFHRVRAQLRAELLGRGLEPDFDDEGHHDRDDDREKA